MTEPKFCKDCKHYSPPWGAFGMNAPARCRHPHNMTKPELVEGRSWPAASNEDLRKAEGDCGPDGAMFEAKPPEPVPEPLQIVHVYPPPRKPRLWDLFR